MTLFVYANNARSVLASGIIAADTTATLADGSSFPTPGAGEQFALTFVNAAGTVREIVFVTDRTGDVVTMVRGQEGTTAADWTAGTTCGELWTKEQAENLIQTDTFLAAVANLQLQVNGVLYTASGGANTKAITPTLPDPAIDAYADGQTFSIRNNTTNTTAVTLNVGGLGAVAVIDSNGSPLTNGEWPAGRIGLFTYYSGSFVWRDSPTSVTPAAADDSKRVATTEWVNDAIATQTSQDLFFFGQL